MKRLITACSILVLLVGCAVPAARSAAVDASTEGSGGSTSLASATDANRPSPGSTDRPPLPSGPGLLLGSRMSYADFEKNNAAHGITDQDVIEQDKFFVDLQQDVSFADPSKSIEKPSQVTLLYGEVPADGWLVVEYTGTSCFSPVGGRINATSSSVDVALWVGLDPDVKACSVRLNYYRATFFVAGLPEGATVTSGGATIAAGVVPPFLAQLDQLAIWPDAFPPYPG